MFHRAALCVVLCTSLSAAAAAVAAVAAAAGAASVLGRVPHPSTPTPDAAAAAAAAPTLSLAFGAAADAEPVPSDSTPAPHALSAAPLHAASHAKATPLAPTATMAASDTVPPACAVRFDAPVWGDVMAGDAVQVHVGVTAALWPVRLCLVRIRQTSTKPGSNCLQLEPSGATPGVSRGTYERHRPLPTAVATGATLVVLDHTEQYHTLKAMVWVNTSVEVGHADGAPAHFPPLRDPECEAMVRYITLDVPAWQGEVDLNWWQPHAVTPAAMAAALAAQPAPTTPPPPPAPLPELTPRRGSAYAVWLPPPAMSLAGFPNRLGPDASSVLPPPRDRAHGGAPSTATGAPPPLRVLVATFAGAATKPLVARSVAALVGNGSAPHHHCAQPPWAAPAAGSPPACVVVDVLLCVYDDSDWSDMAWVASPRTVVVRAKQMKWWFVKRWLPPATSAAYDYVVLMDDDVSLPTHLFNLPAFVHTMHRHGVAIGQPSHARQAGTTWALLFHRDFPRLGWWTNFAECGPLVAFHASAWPCVWDLLQPDLASGYGYDLVWGPLCAPNNTAVVNTHQVVHEDMRVASKRPNGYIRMVAEGITLLRRLKEGAWRGVVDIAPVTPEVVARMREDETRRLPDHTHPQGSV